MKPKVLVLRTAGTNCEIETAYAFELVGAEPVIHHVNQLRDRPKLLREVQVLALPGGFSYGDDVASGRIFANELKAALGEELVGFVERGGFVIGICNGFQVLVKSGLLPRLEGRQDQQVTLTDNDSALYTDRWVDLQPNPARCLWIPDDQPVELPVAHAEGKFVAPQAVIEELSTANQIALRYTAASNPNGSLGNIAGICDPSGRVFGLMPHPERFVRWEHHPRWTREARRREGDGVRFFRQAIRHLQ